jgi:hypothetical protein
VYVDEAALSGDAGRSDLPIDVVKRIACDGAVIAVFEDERGAALDFGRKQRTAIRRYVRNVAIWLTGGTPPAPSRLRLS